MNNSLAQELEMLNLKENNGNSIKKEMTRDPKIFFGKEEQKLVQKKKKEERTRKEMESKGPIEWHNRMQLRKLSIILKINLRVKI